MLLPDNINPVFTIYYNGAIVLENLKKFNNKKIIELYGEIKKNNSMSFSIFILCLDWLYIIGAILIDEKMEVKLCS